MAPMISLPPSEAFTLGGQTSALGSGAGRLNPATLGPNGYALLDLVLSALEGKQALLQLRGSATMMFGHVETFEERDAGRRQRIGWRGRRRDGLDRGGYLDGRLRGRFEGCLPDTS